MLTDTAVWACIFAAISSGLSYWLFAQYGPLYIHEVGFLELKKNFF